MTDTQRLLGRIIGLQIDKRKLCEALREIIEYRTAIGAGMASFSDVVKIAENALESFGEDAE